MVVRIDVLEHCEEREPRCDAEGPAVVITWHGAECVLQRLSDKDNRDNRAKETGKVYNPRRE